MVLLTHSKPGQTPPTNTDAQAHNHTAAYIHTHKRIDMLQWLLSKRINNDRFHLETPFRSRGFVCVYYCRACLVIALSPSLFPTLLLSHYFVISHGGQPNAARRALELKYGLSKYSMMRARTNIMYNSECFTLSKHACFGLPLRLRLPMSGAECALRTQAAGLDLFPPAHECDRQYNENHMLKER